MFVCRLARVNQISLTGDRPRLEHWGYIPGLNDDQVDTTPAVEGTHE